MGNKIIYNGSSNINLTSFYKNLLTINFCQKIIPVFLRILPASLYTTTIAWAASLCSFHKKFVIACPAITAQKFYIYCQL